MPGESLYLMPTGDIRGLEPDARVVPSGRISEAAVGEELLGRIIDGSGKPLDGKGILHTTKRCPLNGVYINPLARAPIREPLDVGIRAINALLSVGRGQRLGLFAGSGVGKSVLLGMMTRYTDADVVVVGLIGERGREVKEFVDNILGEEGLAPFRRGRGAGRSAATAAYARRNARYRNRRVFPRSGKARPFADGFVDPLCPGTARDRSRHQRASRDQGLPTFGLCQVAATGRAGRQWGPWWRLHHRVLHGVGRRGRSQRPIADAARAILDGHIVLSRRLAESGQYPAIDIEASVSRAMNEITDAAHKQAVREFKQLYSLYQQNQDLISVGAYELGSNDQIDLAIGAMPSLREFLHQDMHIRF